MRLRKDVVLAPVTKGLKNAVVQNKWFYDIESNWKLGFGKGLVGVDAFAKRFKSQLEQKDNVYILGVYFKNTPAGFVSIMREERTAKLFFYIAPEYRGVFNLANTALYWCVKGLFTKTNIFRIQIDLLSINKEAKQFLRNFGFKQEGIQKSSYWMGVNSFNTVILAMLKPEFHRMEVENA